MLRLFDTVHEALDKRGIAHALIGGLALGTAGVPRATDDVDLLVDGARENEVHRAMLGLGFVALYRTENVSNYALATRRVDFVHARRPYAQAMLAEARRIESGGRVFRAALPEDLIGLKVQATSNDPRRTQDIEDIRAILAANPDLDMARVRRHFELFDRVPELDALRRDHDGD